MPAPYTELALTGTPGRRHSFSAKTAADVAVAGPYLVADRGIYIPGASDRNVFTPGAMGMANKGIYVPGAADKEVVS